MAPPKTKPAKTKPAKPKSATKIDLKSPAVWKVIAAEFHAGAKTALKKLAAKKNPQVPSLKFWVHVDYMPVYIYTDEHDDGDGVGAINLPTLAKEYRQAERGEVDRSLTYPKLEKALHAMFAEGISKLVKEGAFAPFCADHLAILAQTVDSDEKVITTLGDAKSIRPIFDETPLALDVATIGPATPTSPWWVATVSGQTHHVKVSAERTITVSGRTCNDWADDGDHNVWSHRVVDLLQKLGVQRLSIAPMTATQTSTKQRSKTFYRSVRPEDAHADVFFIEADDERKEDYVAEADDASLLRFAPGLTRASTPAVFRVEGWRRGLVVSDDVKRAIEASALTGFSFAQLKPQQGGFGMGDLTTLAEQGDLDASWRLGVELVRGRRTAQDIPRALALFERVLLSEDLDVIAKVSALPPTTFAAAPGARDIVVGLEMVIKDELETARNFFRRAAKTGGLDIGHHLTLCDARAAELAARKPDEEVPRDKPPNAIALAITSRVSDAEFAKILSANLELVNDKDIFGHRPINTALMFSGADGLGKVRALVEAGADLRMANAKRHAKALGPAFAPAYEYLKSL